MTVQTIGITIGMTQDASRMNFYILDVIREKMEFPDVLKKIQGFTEENPHYRNKKIIVEDVGSGKAII